MGLDTVELALSWEESFGTTIANADLENVSNSRQAIDLICRKVGAVEDGWRACLAQRAFHRLRRSLVSAAGLNRGDVHPRANLRELISTDRQRRWEAVRLAVGIPSLPRVGLFEPRSVEDFCIWIAGHAAKDLKPVAESWTRAEVRAGVRSAIRYVTGQKHFSDDAEFVRDLGLD